MIHDKRMEGVKGVLVTDRNVRHDVDWMIGQWWKEMEDTWGICAESKRSYEILISPNIVAFQWVSITYLECVTSQLQVIAKHFLFLALVQLFPYMYEHKHAVNNASLPAQK